MEKKHESSGDESEDPTPVNCYFNKDTREAIRLWSDGTPEPAESYYEGDKGMVVAAWADGVTYECSMVPNSKLSSTGVIEWIAAVSSVHPWSLLNQIVRLLAHLL